MGFNSSLTFNNCNVTTGPSTATTLWEDHNSPFVSFKGDYTARVIMVNSVARFSHTEAAVLNKTKLPLMPAATADPEIGSVYSTGTGAWAATIIHAESYTRTVDIQFGQASGPGIQQIFQNTIVWCAATWADSLRLVSALDSTAKPDAALSAPGSQEEMCAECCSTARAAGLGRGRTVGGLTMPPPPAVSGPRTAAAGPVGPADDTPSRQSGKGTVPRLVLILPLAVAAIALAILLAVVIRPIVARARRRGDGHHDGIDMHMTTSGAAGSYGSTDAKAPAAPHGSARGTRSDSRQHSIFLDSLSGGNDAPSLPTDPGSSEYDSGSQGVDAFKIYNNSSFNPDA